MRRCLFTCAPLTARAAGFSLFCTEGAGRKFLAPKCDFAHFISMGGAVSCSHRIWPNGRTQMRKIGLFAVVATLALGGVGAWAASNTHSRLSAPSGGGIDTTEITKAVTDLPHAEFVDRSFVFN